MYSSEILVERIKSVSKQKGFLLKDVLQANGLGVNALNQLSNKKGLSSLALAGIADYLDVSVDYLLGRTDDPHFWQQKNELVALINQLTPDEQQRLMAVYRLLKDEQTQAKQQ